MLQIQCINTLAMSRVRHVRNSIVLPDMTSNASGSLEAPIHDVLGLNVYHNALYPVQLMPGVHVFVKQDEEGHATPRAKWCSRRTLALASSQLAAASRVPYYDTLSRPYSGVRLLHISGGKSMSFSSVISV